MKIKTNRLLADSSLLFLLNISASALNYLCQLVMARVLSVESFGTVNTIFSFMMIVAVPGTTLTMIVAKYFAENDNNENHREYLKYQLKNVIILTIIFFAVMFLGKSFLSHILSISNIHILMLAIIIASCGFFQPLYSGVFSGLKAFMMVGIYSMFIPLYKLLSIGIACISSDNDYWRLYITLILILLGTGFTACCGHIISLRVLRTGNCPVSYSNKNHQFSYSADDFALLFLNLSLMFYMNIDLLSVRYLGANTESGLYSSVLLFGRVVYYFATTLGTILLPSVANSYISNKDKLKSLNKALVMMLGFSIVCLLPINILKSFLLSLLYGDTYIQAGKYVIYSSIIAVSLSLYTIIVNYVAGTGKTRKVLWVMAVVDVILIGLFFVIKNVELMLLSIGLTGVVGAVIIYILVLREVNRCAAAETLE